MNTRLISLGIILIPFFNDFPLFGSSHLLRSPSFYPFIVGGLLWIVWSKGKVRLPGKRILLFYLTFILFSSIINIVNMYILNQNFELALTLNLKSTVTLYLLIFIMVYTYNILINKSNWIEFIERSIRVSFLILIPYVLLEMIVLHFNIFHFPFDIIEKLFHSRIYSEIELHKIRGYAFEGSYFSLVLAFIYPFILKSFLSKNRNWINKILFIILLGIIITAQSRSIIFIFIFQTLLYTLMNYKISFNNLKISYIFSLLIVLLIITGPGLIKIILTLTEFSETNISNVMRLFSAYYAVQIGLDNPFFGTGIGLSGAYIGDYYNESIFIAYTAQDWIQNSDTMSVPVFSLLPKMMAEIGVIGLSLYLSLSLFPVWQIKKLHRNNNIPDNVREVGLVIITMVVGLLIASFAVDTHYFYGYWIALSFIYTYTYKLKEYEKDFIYR